MLAEIVSFHGGRGSANRGYGRVAKVCRSSEPMLVEVVSWLVLYRSGEMPKGGFEIVVEAVKVLEAGPECRLYAAPGG